MVWFLLLLPVFLLILLSLLLIKYKKESRLERLHSFVGLYGEVISTVDRNDGAVVVCLDDKELIVFCTSYGSTIPEGVSVLVTEYNFEQKIFKVEQSPRKIYRN